MKRTVVDWVNVQRFESPGATWIATLSCGHSLSFTPREIQEAKKSPLVEPQLECPQCEAIKQPEGVPVG